MQAQHDELFTGPAAAIMRTSENSKPEPPWPNEVKELAQHITDEPPIWIVHVCHSYSLRYILYISL